MAVEIHWVPGHMGFAGNEIADEAAKEAAERLGTSRCSEQFALLAYVSRTITEHMWKDTNHWFSSRYDRQGPLQRARY